MWLLLAMVVSAARWVRMVWVSEAVWHRGWSPVEGVILIAAGRGCL